MRHIITFVGILLLAQSAVAQSDYDDLKILYADENYEKLVKEAEKYTENDKTKYDPVPYFWAAKGLYKISLSGTDDENFKNAYKDGINFLSKGIKYDLKKNDGQALEEFGEFVDEYQLSLYTRINNEMSAEAYKKAYSWVMKYKKITEQMAGVEFVIGACKYRDGDRTTARNSWTEGERLLKEVTDMDSWSEADRNLLKMGILQSARVYKDTQQKDKAKEILNKAAQWFEEDEDWKTEYDDIVNG